MVHTHAAYSCHCIQVCDPARGLCLRDRVPHAAGGRRTAGGVGGTGSDLGQRSNGGGNVGRRRCPDVRLAHRRGSEVGQLGLGVLVGQLDLGVLADIAKDVWAK